MTNQDNDRFGMPESAFEAARESHGYDNPVYRMGMYVPTRREVATLSPQQLYPILIDWIWDSPSELIPDDAQLTELRSILIARPDVDDPVLQDLIGECDVCLHGSTPK
jgi:hypothetical protein